MSENKRTQIHWGKEIWDLVKMVVVALLLVFVFTQFIASPIRVNQNSMYPTLHDQDIGFAGRITVEMDSIERFDIVVIRTNGEFLIKRVVGLPGETIWYKDGELYVDGVIYREEFLNAEYVAEQTADGSLFTADVPEITLGDQEYYCLGDNRPNSRDSRIYGPFNKRVIEAAGVLILYPFNHLGVAN